MRSLNFRVRSIRHQVSAWVRSSPAARASLKFIVVLLAVALPISIVLTQSGLHAGANTITVNSLIDSATTSGNGFCDLREAIDNAQSNTDTTGGDCAVGMGNATIYFGVSGTITLVSDLPSIGSTTLTVDGVGQTITIDGDSLYGWQNTIGPLTLNNLTIAHGNSSAITNEGHLTVTNVTFSDNSAGSGDGGAINNLANLTVTNCTFTGNSAPIGAGGAIWNLGTLGITNSLFSDNTAQDGGGIFNSESDNLGVTTSTFSGNTASGGTRGGGGIFNYDAPMTVTKSLFSGNSASALDGGGIGDFNGDDNIVNCTFSDNSAADGGRPVYGGDKFDHQQRDLFGQQCYQRRRHLQQRCCQPDPDQQHRRRQHLGRRLRRNDYRWRLQYRRRRVVQLHGDGQREQHRSDARRD